MNRGVIDVSRLPSFAFHHRSLMWWGTMGLVAIEGMMFALLIVTYLYLKGRNPHWPPGFSPPDAFWGTVNTIVMLGSLVPNYMAKRAAEHLDLYKARLWLGIALALGFAFSVIRVPEFMSLNVWWDDNAYGSIVWTLMGFHTLHLLTDVVDTSTLWALLFIGPLEESNLVDVAENCMYWNFVVVSWIPVYAVIYLVPKVW